MKVIMEFEKDKERRSYEFWISGYTLQEIEQKAKVLYTQIHQTYYDGTREIPIKFYTKSESKD